VPTPEGSPEPEFKPWTGPPAGWIGGYVPWRADLAQNDRVQVQFCEVVAYPSGVEFTILIRRPPRSARGSPGRDEDHRATAFGAGGSDIKLVYVDGRSASLADQPTAVPADHRPSRPVLRILKGDGSRGEIRYRCWLWPLPPRGPLAVVLTWPSEGLQDKAQFDAGELNSAARRAEQVSGFDSRKARSP